MFSKKKYTFSNDDYQEESSNLVFEKFTQGYFCSDKELDLYFSRSFSKNKIYNHDYICEDKVLDDEVIQNDNYYKLILHSKENTKFCYQTTDVIIPYYRAIQIIRSTKLGMLTKLILNLKKDKINILLYQVKNGKESFICK